MAVTRLKRKERRNKTTARVRVENIKLHKSRLFVKSPYADESGIILEDAAETTSAKVESPVVEAPVVETAEISAETETTAPESTEKSSAAESEA